MKIRITRPIDVDVKTLAVSADVPYFEGAVINGQEDKDGTLTPLCIGESWAPEIDIDTGKINHWPEGTTADIHFKVRDCGTYTLLDAHGNVVVEIDGYVPKIMCPGGDGYGDYIIMKIGPDGKIANWKPTFDEFSDNE